MKKILLLFICLLVSALVYSQHEKGHTELEQVEVSPPEFTGIKGSTNLLNGETSHPTLLSEYILNHVKYPETDIERNREGKEIIRFVVQPDGTLTDFTVINSVSEAIDEEVVNALKTTEGMWKPGFNNEKLVPMEKEFSMVFKLATTRDLTAQATTQYRRGNKLLLLKYKPKRALRHFEQGLVYVPKSKPLLFLRGFAQYQLGEKDAAYQDWNRVKELGGIDADGWLDNLCEMKGYAEMQEIMEE